VYELFERMAYYGIASNLVMYMTRNLHQGIVEASNNVTNWSGTVFLTPLIGAVIADAYLGRYWTFVAGSAIYLMVRPPSWSQHSFFSKNALIMQEKKSVNGPCLEKTTNVLGNQYSRHYLQFCYTILPLFLDISYIFFNTTIKECRLRKNYAMIRWD
jgi:hypothetical protein